MFFHLKKIRLWDQIGTLFSKSIKHDKKKERRPRKDILLKTYKREMLKW